LLGEVASGQVALAHEALDAHPARRGADYLRHLLVANGVLPARDDGLVRLEAWVGGRLASIEDKPRRQLLRSYATWHLLRGARQRAGTARAPRAPTRYAKVNLNSAIAFLGFLAARQRDLAGATQADVDAWLADGPPNAPEVRDFLGWAARRKLVPAFVLPVSTRHEGPVADDDERWATARLLLQGDDVELTDRVAGLLVLLYGQRLSRIVALTRDQVELAPGAVRLHLGTTPLEVPPPLDELVARLVKERRPYAGAGSPAATPWLFSGLDPGLPLTAGQLGRRLRRLGVRPAANRRSALAHLASRLPAAMLAQALGYSPGTAVRWAGQVGADWGNYAASFARSAPTGR
jgi:integrase